MDHPAHKTRKHLSIWLAIVFLILIALTITLVSVLSYRHNVTPRDPKSTNAIRVTITPGSSIRQIALELEAKQIIRSAFAMEQYIQFERPQAKLQAGRYALSPRDSVSQIVKHLESGKTDLFMVTILPGRILDEIKTDLMKKGYTANEVTAAFRAPYRSELLKDKPSSADLEGYLYPETFEMQSDTPLNSLFERSMDTLYKKIKNDKLETEFKKRNLSLFQALTLASIIQEEASDPNDQKQIAQVFFLRLQKDMKLETDPTFIYAAKKLGVPPRVDVDSPYNTRLHKGLPPGPIGNMNYSALEAVAFPAEGEYLYFVSGDNGITYFSKTLEEHERNVKTHCKKLCQLF